jgi:DNA-binding NarL/FixJ family response regulator
MRVQWQSIGILDPVYRLVCQGLNDWQIADKLKVTQEKVHRSVSWILYFQHSRTRTELVRQVNPERGVVIRS